MDRGITVAVRKNSLKEWRFASPDYPVVKVPVTASPVPLKGNDSWVNYPLGCLASFAAFELTTPDGVDFACMSDLPVGAGLSSSAAMENASTLALLSLTGQSLPTEKMVLLSKKAENDFVGMPCGVLDQGVSGFGEENALVYIDCRPPLAFSTVPFKGEGGNLWIFNTHTKHALVDGMYSKRHEECMTAAKVLGQPSLRTVTPEMLEAKKDSMDENVYKRAKHVITEISRVAEAQTAIRSGNLKDLGKLLVKSHRSSQHLFENSTPELDLLVDTLEGMQHVYGARLTGGGFGGAVMALCDSSFGTQDSEKVKKAYEAKFGETVDVLTLKVGKGTTML